MTTAGCLRVIEVGQRGITNLLIRTTKQKSRVTTGDACSLDQCIPSADMKFSVTSGFSFPNAIDVILDYEDTYVTLQAHSPLLA